MLIAVIGASRTMTGQKYISSRGIAGAIPVDVSRLSRFDVKGTPTMLLYGVSGKVRGTWVGLLSLLEGCRTDCTANPIL